jgi:hypothetical protein
MPSTVRLANKRPRFDNRGSVAETPAQPLGSSERLPEVLLAEAQRALERDQRDAMKELAEEIDDIRRRYLAERG